MVELFDVLFDVLFDSFVDTLIDTLGLCSRTIGRIDLLACSLD